MVGLALQVAFDASGCTHMQYYRTCLSDRQGHINFFCCFVDSDKDPDCFEKKLCKLGKYHACNIQQWEGGSCDFHSLKACVCKQCDDDDDKLTCGGKLYATKNALSSFMP